jgi:hypothetical protein
MTKKKLILKIKREIRSCQRDKKLARENQPLFKNYLTTRICTLKDVLNWLITEPKQ